jgi:hypothetical protein
VTLTGEVPSGRLTAGTDDTSNLEEGDPRGVDERQGIEPAHDLLVLRRDE